MPVRFFSDADRERLSRFPTALPWEDCITYFTLAPTDLQLVRAHRGDQQRIGFALQLGALRYLGFAPDELTTAPESVVRYVAQQLEVAPKALALYGAREHTRTDHLQEIQAYLGFRDATAQDIAELESWLVERALEHDKPTLLFQLAAERLHTGRIVRLGVTRLERLVASARDQAQEETFRQVGVLLTEERVAALDHLLLVSPETNRTPLTWLRQGAVANTPAAILSGIAKLTYLRALGVEQWDLGALTPNRQKFLAQVGKKATNQALQRAPAERRYPNLLAFLRQALEEITDETVDLFDFCLAHAYNRAGHDLEDFRKASARATNEKIIYFDRMARLTLDPTIPDKALRAHIYQDISPAQLQAALEDCQRLLRPLDDNYFDFLAQRYSYIRQFAPVFLEAFTFRSHERHDPLLAAIEVLRHIKRKVPEDAPVDFVPAKWRPYVMSPSGTLNRRYYELCVLMQVRGALRAGNLWLEQSRRYADPATYLIPRDRWLELRPEVCHLLHAPEDGAERLRDQQTELETLLVRLDTTLPDNPKVRIEQNDLIVSPLRAEKVPERVKTLQHLVAGSLPLTEVVDLLIEVDELTHFSDQFVHAGGFEPRHTDHKKYLYAAILAQACNIGVTRMAHLADLSVKQLIWYTDWYLREETLRPAIATIVNFHYHLPLSQVWGGGTMSSSDGQRFPVPVKARNAVALPRYFLGHGVTFYTWTSDQSSQYGVKVTVSTLRDAPCVLDEILDNETELPIIEHATDTSGYTEMIFGLFSLLGLQFSPRIRDLGDQRLYRMDPAKTYQVVEPLLKGTIKQELILKHWDDLLRVAGSLKLEWVTASLFVSKLQAYPRQNVLARALQEYGRLVKSVFILKYLESEDYRRRINTQLNKGDSLHALRLFLFFAHQGQVRQRQPEEQTNQASCLTLLTNAVVTWNTLYMMDALTLLRQKGYAIAEEDLVHLSPTLFAHINPYGRYQFDIREDDTPRQRRPLRDPEAPLS